MRKHRILIRAPIINYEEPYIKTQCGYVAIYTLATDIAIACISYMCMGTDKISVSSF